MWCRSWEDSHMERVLGIGGYFMRATDPVALAAWYRDCLGLDIDENGLWHQEAGPTVFATFESETDYLGIPRTADHDQLPGRRPGSDAHTTAREGNRRG